MKRILAISLSLAMVFALFGAMTVSVSAETVEKTLYSLDDGVVDGVKAYSMDTSVSTTEMNEGSGSLRFHPKAAKWTGTNAYVTSDSFTNFVTFDIPEGLNITGSVGFNLYKNSNNSSSYEALGVKMANNVIYFTKTSNFAGAKTWTKINLTGKTMYKLNDSSTSITLKADNFADTAADESRVIRIIYLQCGTADDWNFGYLDNVFYETDAATSPVTEITMESGAAMRIDGTTNGIRFEASVDKSAFDAIKDKTNIEIGTLIAKEGTEKSKVVVENAVDTGTGAKKLTGDQIPVAKYASTTTMADIEGTDKYVIYGSLVGIDDGNATQKYVARAYVKYTDESGEHVLYAENLSEPRSLAEVAYKLKNDTAVPEGMSNTYYNSLCQTHKDYVDGLAIQYVE